MVAGVSVALFWRREGDKQAIQFMEQLCKRYPSVNFLKVDPFPTKETIFFPSSNRVVLTSSSPLQHTTLIDQVEVEEHSNIARSEGVSSFPTFIVYKNGSRVKEIPGDKRNLLENTVKSYST